MPKANKPNETPTEGIDSDRQRLFTCLQEGKVDEAIIIRDAFGQGIPVNKLAGYADAVRECYITCLQEGRKNDALKTRDELGQEIDFSGLDDSVKTQ